MTVRQATLADLPAICAMGQDLIRESPRFSRWPYNQEKAESVIKSCMAMGSAWVLVSGDGPHGFALATVVDHWALDYRMVVDMSVYVRPESRGHPFGWMRMVDAIEAWAVEMQADEVVLGVSTGINVERASKMLERIGYLRSGVSFRRAL